MHKKLTIATAINEAPNCTPNCIDCICISYTKSLQSRNLNTALNVFCCCKAIQTFWSPLQMPAMCNVFFLL